VLFRSVLAALMASYALTFTMNVSCLALPTVSPILLVPTWEKQVQDAWTEWEDLQQYAAGMPRSNPQPNATWILLKLLIPFVLIHGLIAAVAVIVAIQQVRVRCLEPGETIHRGIPIDEEPLFVRKVGGRHRRRTDQLALAVRHWAHPVREPALLWREIYHGIPAAPGPGPEGWLLPSIGQASIFLGTSAILSLLVYTVSPTGWDRLMAALNEMFRFVSVLILGTWCWFLAFRAAGCVSRERERQTLDGLLVLPVDRDEILRAKWLGNVLRFRELAYVLAMVLVPGLVIGALHPGGVLLFAAAAGVHLAFLASLGLWLSLVSRSTLWANMTTSVILLLLFGGLRLVSMVAVSPQQVESADWLYRLLHLGIAPGQVWWFALFSWRDVAEASPSFERALLETCVSLPLFAAAAWGFWRLSRRRFQ
jgi:hypothetical protein